MDLYNLLTKYNNILYNIIGTKNVSYWTFWNLWRIDVERIF